MMRRLLLAIVAGFACAQLAWVDSGLAATADFFTDQEVHQFDIHLSNEAWQEAQPGRAGWARRAARPTTRRSPRLGLDGGEYPWVEAAVSSPGLGIDQVALRFKGNTSYQASQKHLNRPMKLQFDRIDAEGRFLGLKSLNLNNNTLDPSCLREVLSYDMFRRAGVPAPRAKPVKVRLSIDGLCEAEPIGVYSAVEEVDKRFLKRHFGTSDGLLLKPEGAEGLQLYGHSPETLAGYYVPKSAVPPAAARRFWDFLALVHRADDEAFADEIESFLPMDEFLRFLAVNAMLANFDSILSTGHNLYIYVHPQTGKVHFIPWDLNFSFGGYVRTGSADDLARLSINQFWIGRNRLFSRVLAIPAYKTRFREILGELNRDLWDLPAAQARIERIQQLSRPEPGAATRPAGLPPAVAPKTLRVLDAAPDLLPFMRARQDSIAAQLTGKEASAYVPRFRYGAVSGFISREQSPPTDLRPNRTFRLPAATRPAQ